MKNRRLIFIQLNELNFDLVQKYAEKYELKNFSRILNWKHRELSSEKEYELLEPWIQWVSVSTGATAEEHGVERLGDINRTEIRQLYEEIEGLGYSVGALSLMNVSNRLKRSHFFIPDPWTNTAVSGTWLDKKIYESLKQAVNDNSNNKIEMKSYLSILVGLLRYSSIKNWFLYVHLALQSRRRIWNKALFLDLFMSDYFIKKTKNTDFNVIFLNSLAHIQHHYFKNSEFRVSTSKNPDWLVDFDQDPLFDGLRSMDKMLGNILSWRNCEYLIATGLSQVEYEPEDYYYRPRNHQEFLDIFEIKCEKVMPRMTRDFEITFSDDFSRDVAAERLASIKINGNECFGVINKRRASLFLTLTYNKQLTAHCVIQNASIKLNAKTLLTFVALKNGHHSQKSWIYYTDGLSKYAPSAGDHVKGIYFMVKNYFSGVEKPPMH